MPQPRSLRASSRDVWLMERGAAPAGEARNLAPGRPRDPALPVLRPVREELAVTAQGAVRLAYASAAWGRYRGFGRGRNAAMARRKARRFRKEPHTKGRLRPPARHPPHLRMRECLSPRRRGRNEGAPAPFKQQGRWRAPSSILILRSRALRGVSKGEASWFETRGFAALLTMRG